MRSKSRTHNTVVRLSLLLLVGAAIQSAHVAARGKYSGPIDVRLNGDGRTITLLEPLSYTDSSGRRWLVPTGSVVDGASIPQWLWSVAGGPLEGKYRDASVIHDYYCDKRNRRAIDVHNVFYDAMLASGVNERRAWMMHQMVVRFGPTWPDPKIHVSCQKPDGTFDFKKCTENRVDVKPSISFPPVTEAAIEKALDDARGQASEEDIELVRKAYRDRNK